MSTGLSVGLLLSGGATGTGRADSAPALVLTSHTMLVPPQEMPQLCSQAKLAELLCMPGSNCAQHIQRDSAACCNGGNV